MDPCHLRRRNHVGIAGTRIKAGDIVPHRARQQIDLLGQIAHHPAQPLGAPLRQQRTAQPHLACIRRPGPDQHARQGGFSGSTVADHPQPVAGVQPKAHLRQQAGPVGARPARREFRDLRHDQLALGQGQIDAGLRIARRRIGKEGRQTAMGMQRPPDQPPLAGDLIDRRQRTPGQHGGGNDAARRNLALQDKIGAQRQDGRLQQHAKGARHGRQPFGRILADLPGGQRRILQAPPVPVDRRLHPHGHQRLGIAAAAIGKAARRRLKRPGTRQRLAQDGPVRQRQRQPGQRPAHRQPAQPGMQHEQHPQEQRQPGQVEQRLGAGAGNRPAQGFQIAQRLGLVVGRAGAALDPGAEGGGAKAAVQPDGHAPQQAPAQEIIQRQKPVEHHHDGEQADQGGHRPAGQHPVIDLHHVDRAGQHEHVDGRAEQGNDKHPPAQAAQHGLIGIAADPRACLV